MKYRYKMLLFLLFIACAVLSYNIDIFYNILIIIFMGWSAFIPSKLIEKHYGGNADLSKSAGFAQRALTLWSALSIFIAGSLIISVVLGFLLSIRVFVKFD